MSRLLVSTALAALLLSAPAFAGVDKVEAIDVTVDLASITNPAAALRFSHIADDLKNAIAALLTDRLAAKDEKGEVIHVDISEVELSNTFTETSGLADTHLVGIVSITDSNDNSNFANYTLTVDVNQAKTFLPTTVDMATLKASSDDYYHALIAAFAQHVADNLAK